MTVLFYVFFGLSLMCWPVCALQQASLFRNQESFVNHGNFIPVLFHYLSATKITSILVNDDSDCPFECIDDRKCFSFNVAAYPDSRGLYSCELLDTDRYKTRNKLQANASFHHYSPWTPCSTGPCLNVGDCTPDFQKNSFQCVCKPGFYGTHCEVCKFDFEDGIDGWIKTGSVFHNQPTYGDNPSARNSEYSKHQGNWWIGGYENRSSKNASAGEVQGDGPQGTLTFPSFKIIGELVSFLIGGGCDMENVRAELIIGQKVIRNATGACNETMTRKVWNVYGFVGQRARVKLVDSSSSSWGHINFDDLKGDISCA